MRIIDYADVGTRSTDRQYYVGQIEVRLWEAGVELLISFNYDDKHLAEALQASLFMAAPNFDVVQFVLSPTSYGAVRFDKNIAGGVYEADAFLLIVGPRGIGRWQERECQIALERNRKDASFIVLPVLVGSQVPTAEYLRGLNWIRMPVVTDRRMVQWLVNALKLPGEGTQMFTGRRGAAV